MHEAEILERWTPIDHIDDYFVSAEVVSNYPSLFVRLIDGRVDGLDHRDLVFIFEKVPAFTVHEEFVHPTQGTTWGREPRISESNPATFPCLLVRNSPWFHALEDELSIHDKGAVHYRLCTMWPVIDIINVGEPRVHWHRRDAAATDTPLPPWA